MTTRAVSLDARDVQRRPRVREDDRRARARLDRRAASAERAGARLRGGGCARAFEVDDRIALAALDPRQLPRDIGLAADRHCRTVAAALRRRGAIKGACEPPLDSTARTPRCTAALPGYVVRFSPCSRCAATRCRSTSTRRSTTRDLGQFRALRFERAYQVVPHGDEWRAVREGRVPKEIRGEPK